MFSPNEILEDVSTRDLAYLLVPFVAAELEGRIRTIDSEERMIHLRNGQRYLRAFLESLETYDIVPAEERELYEKRTSEVRDPTKRRELKIRQYQKEKELRSKVEVHQSGCNVKIYDFVLIMLELSRSLENVADNVRFQTVTQTTLILFPLSFHPPSP